MFTSRKLAHVVLALFALAMMSVAALAADPGAPYPATSEASDQKAGSLLVYNYYTSGSSNTISQNSRISITNTSATSSVVVHMFFVAAGCSVADYKTELTPNQTFSFLASEYDPGTTGYLIAIAENADDGTPRNFNWLIGDVYFKAPIGDGNLGAIAFAAVALPQFDPNLPVAPVNLNGIEYNLAGGTLALDNIPSPVGGLNTINVVINGLNGDLSSSMSGAGSYFGLIYDDYEVPSSFQTTFNCGTVLNITATNPRTSPTIGTIIPSGRTGWMRLSPRATGTLPGRGGSIQAQGAVGFMIVKNANSATSADAFNGAHNLHHLTLNAARILVPVFPSQF